MERFACCRALALGPWASVAVAQRLSCPRACGIFPDQESNPCLLHWQVDSLPLSHQESPMAFSFSFFNFSFWASLHDMQDLSSLTRH